ncbi:hypothetical protein AC249_AIPGENE23928, partial [Paramuricea clavata]
MVKRCAWGTCRNDSRFLHLQTKNKNGDPVIFYRFPAPKRWKETAERRERWIIACHRGDSFVCKKDSYICSLHFVGENGPTLEHPDPISAIKSKEKVERLHRKRKAPKQRLGIDVSARKATKVEGNAEASEMLDLLDSDSYDSKLETTKEEIVASESLLLLGEDMTESSEQNDIGSIKKDESVQTNVVALDIKDYSDEMLKSSKKLMKYLFIALVDDPKKTYHYTGLSKEYLNVLYVNVKKKAKSLTMWSGTIKTKPNVGLQSKYEK